MNKPELNLLWRCFRWAEAEIVLADGYFAAYNYNKALRLYQRANHRTGSNGSDHCDLQIARCQAALGKPALALKYYGCFKTVNSRSPLAPVALLYAGTLSAAPPSGNFAAAREWFASVIRNHSGTREALAAEFYDATLAWRSRKWSEAERLHKAFAAAHPDSPLARVALEERLPAIAKKSLAVPLHDPVDRELEVFVRPNDRKRKAIPITKTAAYNAHLDIKPASGYKLIASDITDQNSRGGGVLWTGPDPKTPQLHRYHLSNAYSSQEYVMIDGTIVKPGPGGGGPPPFRVTVPSVDVDWEGFADPMDEDSEDTRHVIVPLTTNIASHRWLQVNIPYDDYGPVHPILTLHWAGANELQLWHENGTLFPNGGQIDSRTVLSWPLRFRVEPLSFTPEFVVRLMGEADNVTGEKAVDTIVGRIVNVDLDVDANYDGDIKEDDEPLEEDPGGLVCVGTNNLTRIELKVEPAGLPGKRVLSGVTGDRIKLWENETRTTEVELPKTWRPDETIPPALYVEGITNSAAPRDVELVLTYDENPEGENNPLFKASDKIRLTVVRIEMITPAGDPVNLPVDGGDGTGNVPDGANEFTFSAAMPGLLTLKLKARVAPSGIAHQIKDQVHFTVDGIGASAMAWNDVNPGGKPTTSGDNMLATVTFTGLPAHNSGFGAKEATVCFNGNKMDENKYEVFYNGFACNHPEADNEKTPNWFHYYKQVEHGTDYQYGDIPICVMICFGDGNHTITIGDNAYLPFRDIVTEIKAGARIATSWSEKFAHFSSFVNSVNHEREHSATCPCKKEPGSDTDGDGLTDNFEIETSYTSAVLAHSARDNGTLDDIKYNDYYNDGELWARHKGICAGLAADTSEDWANPGSNHKSKGSN